VSKFEKEQAIVPAELLKCAANMASRSAGVVQPPVIAAAQLWTPYPPSRVANQSGPLARSCATTAATLASYLAASGASAGTCVAAAAKRLAALSVIIHRKRRASGVLSTEEKPLPSRSSHPDQRSEVGEDQLKRLAKQLSRIDVTDGVAYEAKVAASPVASKNSVTLSTQWRG
jgi:hypothetical protein